LPGTRHGRPHPHSVRLFGPLGQFAVWFLYARIRWAHLLSVSPETPANARPALAGIIGNTGAAL